MRPRLLLIEDSSTARAAALMALSRQGWNVTSRAGEICFEALHLDVFDAFVFDAAIKATELDGEGSGFGLARRLREQGIDAPIVIWSQTDHAERAKDMGLLYAPKDERCRALLRVTEVLPLARRLTWRKNVTGRREQGDS